MDEVSNKIRAYKPDITDSSLKLYIKNISNLYFNVFDEIEFDVNKFNRFKRVEKYIDTHYDNTHTRRNLYINIVVLLRAYKFKKSLIQRYYNKWKELNDSISQSYNNNEKSEHDKQNEITWPDVLNVKQTLKHLYEHAPTHDNLQNYLILCLYTDIPPLRLVYASVDYEDKGDNNYVDVDKKHLILRQYKTKSKYGIKTYELSDDIISLIKQKQQYGYDYLLVNGLKKMSNVNLNRTLNRLFKEHLNKDKNVGVNMLRKAFINHHFKYDENKSKIAHMMNHSPGMQSSVYTKK